MKEQDAIALLRKAYLKGGCARIRDPERQEVETTRRYKKGFEVRLPVKGQEELEALMDALSSAGLKPGKPYAKVHQTIVPVYGRVQIDRFFSMIGEPPSA